MKRKTIAGVLIVVLACIFFASLYFSMLWPGKDGGDAGADGYAPGVYTVESEGFGPDPMVLDVTFSETEITDIVIVSHSETPDVAGPALDTLPGAILEAQTYNVDAVAGCTWTSNGIREAVKSAMEQAAK